MCVCATVHVCIYICKYAYLHVISFRYNRSEVIVYLNSAPEWMPNDVDKGSKAADASLQWVLTMACGIVIDGSSLRCYGFSHQVHKVLTEKLTAKLIIAWFCFQTGRPG